MSEHSSLSRVVALTAALGLAALIPLPQATAASDGPAIRGHLPVATARAPMSAGGAQGVAAAVTGARLDWPQFLHDPQHDSVSNATAFTRSNAASATKVWHWQPPTVSGQPDPDLDASPTVVAGVVYIGALSGGFYALNEATGKMLWSRQLDTLPPTGTCSARGITSTAAVLPDPVTGRRTVYVSGAHHLYALKAATGAVVWKTRIGPKVSNPDAYYNWGSPTVVHGHIYVGLASGCDNPLIRGGVVELDQHTGKVLHIWHSVPAGSIGGSIWSTVAASPTDSDVWVSTGNECDPTINTCPSGNKIGHSLSIVHLSGSLKFLQAWQVPGVAGHGRDSDFGSSPTLFGGTGTPPDVGACNKNGVYYALAANPLSSSPLWALRIGIPTQLGARTGECIASATWDGPAGTFYIGGNTTTIGGVTYAGSIGQVNPATGRYIWHTGMPCSVEGTPTLDGAGVLAVGTYSCPKPATPGAYLINASTGKILKSLPVSSAKVFGQLVFAQGTLFVASATNGLYDFAP